MATIPFISTENAVTVAVDGAAYTIPKTAPNYKDVKSALVRGETDVSIFKRLLNIREYVAQLTEGRAELVDGKLYLDGGPMPRALADRVATMFAEGFGVAPLLRFLNRVAANPRLDKDSKLYSPKFEDELYLFLEGGDCPITENGTFLAYKMVNSDFTDIYTGKMDNSPGTLVSLKSPENVDPERMNTCSYGLHFASLNYVLNGGYGSGSHGHRLVVVEIDPADVISIPYDYGNSKGRAWKYTILREIEWNDRIKPNFISTNDCNGWDDAEDFDEDDYVDDYEDDADEEQGNLEWMKDAEGREDTENEVVNVVAVGVLEDNEVRGIRASLARGETLAAIARFYQVSPRTVARIRDGETYSHVK